MKVSLTGKFLALSIKTVNKAVLISVTRNICVSAKAAFKSFLSELNCIHVKRKCTNPCLACSKVNHFKLNKLILIDSRFN